MKSKLLSIKMVFFFSKAIKYRYGTSTVEDAYVSKSYQKQQFQSTNLKTLNFTVKKMLYATKSVEFSKESP